MKRRVIAVLACCVALSGCDPLFGVAHVAELVQPPPTDCVRQVLASTPGLEFPDQRDPPNVFSYWVVPENGERFLGVLQLQKQESGSYRYRNGNLQIGLPPPQAEINAVRPVLRAIDSGLSERCGLTEPIKEICYRVDCKPF